MLRFALSVLLLGFVVSSRPAPVAGQQVVDSAYVPHVTAPAYPRSGGPVVAFDASHNNPTVDGTLLPLKRVLEADGYVVSEFESGIDAASLTGVGVLAIIDALADDNVDKWVLPVPSALDAAERLVLLEWVRGGGALLLVADHMPFAGAVEVVAAEFGIDVLNGFAIDTVTWDPLMFRKADQTLSPHPIVAGRGEEEQIDSVFTYWGHALRATGPHHRPLLLFEKGTVSLQPREAWRFSEDTEVKEVGGWSQGIALRVGMGRIVMLGDSGMLTAHLVGEDRRPVGLNAPGAEQNEQFVLNVLHWLSGLLEAHNREGS